MDILHDANIMTPEAIRTVTRKLAVFGDTIGRLLGIAQRLTLMADYQTQYQSGATNFEFVCKFEKNDTGDISDLVEYIVTVPIYEVADNPDDLYALRTVVEKAEAFNGATLKSVDTVHVVDAVIISDMEAGYGMPTPAAVGWEFAQYEEDDDDICGDDSFDDDDVDGIIYGDDADLDDDDVVDAMCGDDSHDFDDDDVCGTGAFTGTYTLIL